MHLSVLDGTRYMIYNILICQQFFSGTHAITCALFALLRPGDEVILVITFSVFHYLLKVTLIQL